VLVCTRRYETREFIKPKGLRTFFGRCFLGAGRVAKEVSKFGSDDDFMLLEGLGVEPHQTRVCHVLEQGEPIVLGNIFPVGVMLSVLASQVIKIAFPFVATEV